MPLSLLPLAWTCANQIDFTSVQMAFAHVHLSAPADAQVNEIEECLHRRNPVTDQTHADKQDTQGKQHHSDKWIIMPGSV